MKTAIIQCVPEIVVSLLIVNVIMFEVFYITLFIQQIIQRRAPQRAADDTPGRCVVDDTSEIVSVSVKR